MAYEAQTPFEKFVEETFTRENMPFIRQRWAEVKKLRQKQAEYLEKGRIDGMEKGRAEGMEKGRAEGMEKGRAEGELQGRELTIRTFMSNMPDMPDAEVANLFNVTPDYIRGLRAKNSL